jgi:hypothetical protein
MPATAVLDAISFEAPYVIERLVKDRVVDSVSEAETLFTEAKKYLVLSEANRDVVVGMYSVRVDEAWHAFILYTAQYRQFCTTFFGRFIPHAPKNAPPPVGHDHEHPRELTFAEFGAAYQDLFGEPLPDVWYDIRSVAPARRVFNDLAGRLSVVRRDSVAELLDEAGDIVVSANEIAFDAMEFVARTGAFYVRELPGSLTDGEKVALVEALISAGAVRVAS